MPRRRRPVVGLLLAAALVAVSVAACRPARDASPGPSASPSPSAAAPATPRPAGGRELYGYVPYWEMDRGIADHLAGLPFVTDAVRRS